MNKLVENEPFYDTLPYKSLDLSDEDIYHNFGIKT